MAASRANGDGSTLEAAPDDTEGLERLIRGRWLDGSGGGDGWRLARSPLGGRGVFATRQLRPGDVAFIDTPIAIGPRTCAEGRAACVSCLRSGAAVVLRACGLGCGLPVCCPACLQAHSSSPECRLLRQLGVVRSESWNPDLYRSLTALRCIAISPEDRQIVRRLPASPPHRPAPEVSLLKKGTLSDLPEDDEKWMELCSRVMDSVAFQVVTDDFETEQSVVRGLYPLAGLTNHSCSPNTRQVFSADHEMKLIAVKVVAEGQEITTSYCPLLWATPVRAAFLYNTKHFVCNCARCHSPTEFGTFLSGLKCSCGGTIMPDTPRDTRCSWHCSGCDRCLSAGQALAATSVLSRPNGHPSLSLSLSRTNHLVVDRTVRDIFSKSNRLPGMNETELLEREIKIRQILKLIDQLELGECRTRGLLLNELEKTMKEKQDKLINEDFENKEPMEIRTLEGDVCMLKDALTTMD